MGDVRTNDMHRTAVVFGLAAACAVTIGSVGTYLVRSESLSAERAVAKLEERLPGAGAAAQRSEPIRHHLPTFKWFGERDESRLSSRPIGSYVDVIETDRGVVLVLDAGRNVILEHDPAAASTTIAGDATIPSITPWQAFDTPGEVVITSYGEEAAEVVLDADAAPGRVVE